MRPPWFKIAVRTAPFVQRLLVFAIAVTTVLCTAAASLSRAVRVATKEAKAPVEQEQERESEKESQEIYSGLTQRQRLRAEISVRRTFAAPFTSAGHRHSRVESANGDGHRLPNGLCAPLVC